MTKKTARAKLIKDLDKLSKEVVRKRDGNTCQWCGKWVEGSSRHVSHVFPVSGGNALRWEPLNMKVLCFHCHMNLWHKSPLEAFTWFEKKFPERYIYLKDNRGIKKFTLTELEDLTAKLKAMLG